MLAEESRAADAENEQPGAAPADRMARLYQAPADGGCSGGQCGFYGGDTRGVLPPVGAERS